MDKYKAPNYSTISSCWMWFKHLKFETRWDNLSTLVQKHTFGYYNTSDYANRADYLPVIYFNDRMDCSTYNLRLFCFGPGCITFNFKLLPYTNQALIYQAHRRLPHNLLWSWAFYGCSSQNIFRHRCSPQRHEETPFLLRVSKALPTCWGEMQFYAENK